MEIIKTKYRILLVLIPLFLSSCLEDVDFSGFITNGADVETRFTQSIEWNSTHPPKVRDITNESYTFYVTADVHIGETQNIISFFEDAKDYNPVTGEDE